MPAFLREFSPIDITAEPVVDLWLASSPIEILLEPVVIALPASEPIAILLEPEVFASNALSPIAILLLVDSSSAARAVSSEEIAIEVLLNSPIPPPEAAAHVSPPVFQLSAVNVYPLVGEMLTVK